MITEQQKTYANQRPLETVISVRLDRNLSKGEREYKNTEERRLYTGESYRLVLIEAHSKNKTEERRLGTDLLTEFVQGASKSGSAEDFVCYWSSNLLKCYRCL
jgi:hypothetical protein